MGLDKNNGSVRSQGFDHKITTETCYFKGGLIKKSRLKRAILKGFDQIQPEAKVVTGGLEAVWNNSGGNHRNRRNNSGGFFVKKTIPVVFDSGGFSGRKKFRWFWRP